MGIRHIASISVTNYGLVLAETKIICALEISEDIFNSRPMAFRCGCMSYQVNLQAQLSFIDNIQ